jgi:hypothetical protein
MTIKEKDFKAFAQVRPEIVELADRLLELGGVRDDEHFAFARVGLIYRNQAFRECLLTGRVSGSSKDTYATYQMPNGKAYKVAVDIVNEQLYADTLRVATYDIDEHIGIPCEEVNVFFETNGYAEKVRTYASEAEYIADLPMLEKLARKMGFERVTETIG